MRQTGRQRNPALFLDSGRETFNRPLSAGMNDHTSSRPRTPRPSRKLPCTFAHTRSRGGTAKSQAGRRRASVSRSRAGQKEVAEVLRTSGEADRQARRRQYGKGGRPQPTSTGLLQRATPASRAAVQAPAETSQYGNGADVLYSPRQKYFETPFFGQPRAALTV